MGIRKWSDAVTSEKIICKFMVKVLCFSKEMKMIICIEKPVWAEHLTLQIGLWEVAFKERTWRF